MNEVTALSLFSALAHPLRHRAFRLLVQAFPGSLAAGTISETLGVPASTLSSHLSHLERSGLASTERDGVRIFYTLRPDTVQALLGHLVSDCCDGRPEVCGLSAVDHAGATPS